MNYFAIFVLPVIIFTIFELCAAYNRDQMNWQQKAKLINKMKGFNVKRAPKIHVNGADEEIKVINLGNLNDDSDEKMIAFGNPNGQWPLSGGTGLTAEEQMPISDAKIALDNALIDQYPKIVDQMHKMQIVGAESAKIPKELNILPKHGPNNAPKLGSKNATISKDASGTNATDE